MMPSFEEVYTRDYHDCDCIVPSVKRQWLGALGVFQEIRVCCLSRKIEELTGETFLSVTDFDAQFFWDATELVEQRESADTASGTRKIQKKARGDPPQWMQDRMATRGIRWKDSSGRTR